MATKRRKVAVGEAGPAPRDRIEFRELDPEKVRAQFRLRIPLLRKALERSAKARRVGEDVLRLEFKV